MIVTKRGFGIYFELNFLKAKIMYLSQLTLKDREWLEKLLKQGISLKEIAKRMDRSYSCIRVEVKRSGGATHYNALMAQHLSDSRRTSWRNKDA